MSQSERIAKIHFLLDSGGRVTVRNLMETFEVSRATIMRDIELLRDRLRSPITYDQKKKSYYYSTDFEGSIDYTNKFGLPGIWIDAREGYALLTLLNVTEKIDPGLLMPYTGKLKGLLKQHMGRMNFPTKGFHKKVSIQLPNLSSGKILVVREMSEALVDERQAKVTWLGEDNIPITATVSFQRYVLGVNGWSAEFVNEGNQEKASVPLSKFIDCCVGVEAANLLPEFKSDLSEDYYALMNIYHGRQLNVADE